MSRPESTVPARGRFLLRTAAALLAFAAGLGVFAIFTQTVLNPVFHPRRDTGEPTAKLAELRAIAGDVDVLVLGTSRMLHGFDPQQFDAESARLGRPLRAYNLSLERLLLWEQERVLDAALELPGLQPKLVVLETCVGLGIAPENLTHARTVAFETPASYREALACIVGSNRSLPHQAWNIGMHTLVLGLNRTHYGLYASAAFPPVAAAAAPGDLGFEPLPDPAPGTAPDAWLEQLIRELPATRAREQAATGEFPAPMRRHFERLCAKLRARGIACVFVQPPQLHYTTDELAQLTTGFARAFPPGPDHPAVISYLDPQRHAELYDARLWFDFNHLTAAGARRFTHDLARDLTPRVPQ